jgi:NADPH-dependent 2,4-dienoyl-CoA reductase/sulfur reductase-like enzyme/nitrite reductase/ring-hydroxylating ferredoxin subunit
MASEHEGAGGPDLRQGIPVGDVADGGMMAGQVDGDPVLLVRRGEEWFAVGAACTHYSGPLPEGLVVGDTVRCPWHHACFDLRTGHTLRPPALNDLPSWAVERRDGRVYVGARLKKPAGRPGAQRTTARARAPERVVIIGGGAAGDSAAETLRREGYANPITVVDPDRDAPYDRPNLSKDYLAGSAPEEWIPLHPPEFYQERDIELRRGPRVAAVDTAARLVRLDDGTELPYEALLLATGASPVRLGPEFEPASPAVHYLRSLADSRRIAAAAREGGRAVVLGASFIGLEVAASLRARKMEVHVVAPDVRPLGRVMGPELGDWIRALHETHGVVFHLGRKAGAIRDGAVTLESGERLPAELVVAGIGVRPNLELAQAAGLTIDRGVRVDERLATGAPGVFAAGDIARWPDPHTGDRIRVEHWVVAQRQGQAAARNMLGAAERFEAVPFFWSQHYDQTIAYVGHAEQWDRLELDGDLAANDCAVRFLGGGRLLALATVGRDHASLEAELAIEQAVVR